MGTAHQHTPIVTPAQAGAHSSADKSASMGSFPAEKWIPAFAGMTTESKASA